MPLTKIRFLPLCAAALLLLIAACTAAPTTPDSIPTLALLASPTNTPTIAPTHTPTAAPTDTPPPPPTDSPTATATDTPQPTVTATDTPTSTITHTPITPTRLATSASAATTAPLPTSVGDASISSTSQQLVDLRSGAGFDFPPKRALATGAPLFLIGRSANNDWYQVRLMDGDEGWVSALNLVIWIDTSRLIVTWQEPTPLPVARVGTFALGGHVMHLTPNAYNVARSAGMTWIKVQHRYYVGQDASEVAPMIQSAHQHGFRLLLGVVGDPAQMGDLHSYSASYAAFVADVAALGVDAIEVWNEPNIDREWRAGTIYGANYTQLLAASYTAIKARSPSTIVISAAPAPTGFFAGDGCDTGGCNDDVFFKQMAAAGAADYLDCVGLHHNDGIVSPLASSGDPRGSYPTYYLRGVISRVPPEFNSKPLCFTELGYLSPEGYGALPGAFGWAANTTVANQAAWLSEAVQVARSTGRVEMLIVWNVDFTVYSAGDPMAGYAILRPDGGCPACAVLAQAMQ